MRLRTEIKIPASNLHINHHQKIYFAGSCFSQSIADKFRYYGFNVLSNSHGIIYNPVSMEAAFADLLHQRDYTKDDLNFDGKRYFSYQHHGMFSNANPQQVLDTINHTIQQHQRHLQESSYVFVTLGSAWVYVENQEKKIVANCHKMPAHHFTKKLLTYHQIDAAIESIVHLIQTIAPQANIVFTLSPVKHLKDGFVQNQQSKSLLHAAIQNAINTHVSYFPAYEIMNDDLRDYRFWASDMVHPNQLAIDYIWEKFCSTYFINDTLQIMEKVKAVRQYISHRPIGDDVQEIELLKTQQQNQMNQFIKTYPHLIL